MILRTLAFASLILASNQGKIGLRSIPKEGETRQYAMKIELDNETEPPRQGSPGRTHISLIWNKKISIGKPTPDGTAPITVSEDGFHLVTRPEIKSPPLDGFGYTAVVDPLWHLTDISAPDGAQSSSWVRAMLATIETSPVLPDHDVSIGDAWGIPLPPGLEPLVAKGTMLELKFAGPSSGKGEPAWRFTLDRTIPFDRHQTSATDPPGVNPTPEGWDVHLSGSFHFEGEYLISRSRCVLLSASTHLKGVTHTEIHDKDKTSILDNEQISDSTLAMTLAR